MHSVTESISDAHCVQRLLLIFTRSTATPDVYIKFFPERTYQLILGGGGRGAMRFSNKIFLSSKITLPYHRFIKEFYKIFTPYINSIAPLESTGVSLMKLDTTLCREKMLCPRYKEINKIKREYFADFYHITLLIAV